MSGLKKTSMLEIVKNCLMRRKEGNVLFNDALNTFIVNPLS